MKLLLTIAASTILGGLAAFSLFIAMARLLFDYLRLASRALYPAASLLQ